MPRVQLSLATIAFAVSFAVWGLVSAMAPHFKDMYHLSAIQTSILIAIPVVLGSLFRLPIGIMTDRLGGRKVFSALLAFGIIPAAGIAFMHSYGALLFWAFFLGLAGSSFAVGVAFTSRWFPAEQQGFALGVFGMGNIGQSVAVFFAPRLSSAIGWDKVFLLFGGASLIWAGVFWWFSRNAGVARPSDLHHVIEVFVRERLSWVLAFFYFITFGGFVALGVYLPTLLKGQFHLTLTDAGMKTAGFVVLATLMRPAGGRIADVVGGARVLLVVFVVIAAMAVLLTSLNFTIFSVGALGAAAALGLGNGAVFKLVPEYFPREIGTVTGLVGAIGGLGGFFPPIVLGIVKESTGGYSLGFLLLAVFSLAALALNFIIFLNGRVATIHARRSS